jgi:hypothetical protein
MSRRLSPAIIAILAALFGYARPSVAQEAAADAASPPPAESMEKQQEKPLPPEKPAEKPVAVANPAPAKVVASCPKARIPVYIEDWGRLAELTASDPEVGTISRFWADRHHGTATVHAAGTIIGTGAIFFGTISRLTTDSWTEANKWEIAGGAGLVLVSALTSWLFSPNRDDFLTVINHWNLRHPDRPLAP